MSGGCMHQYGFGIRRETCGFVSNRGGQARSGDLPAGRRLRRICAWTGERLLEPNRFQRATHPTQDTHFHFRGKEPLAFPFLKDGQATGCSPAQRVSHADMPCRQSTLNTFFTGRVFEKDRASFDKSSGTSRKYAATPHRFSQFHAPVLTESIIFPLRCSVFRVTYASFIPIFALTFAFRGYIIWNDNFHPVPTGTHARKRNAWTEAEEKCISTNSEKSPKGAYRWSTELSIKPEFAAWRPAKHPCPRWATRMYW